MSELVERHLESMMEEVQEMKRTRLFSEEETRMLLTKRKQFEYKINGATKDLQNFKDYIMYEKVILKDVKLRRNRLRIMDKKGSIEFRIMKRIKYLYEVAVQRFNNDYQLVLSYFKFCKECNFHQAAHLIIQNMIKNFSQNIEVWLLAAAWYLRKDIKEALNVIHKGIAIHKSSQELYREAIQLELQNCPHNGNTKDDTTANSTQALLCQKIEIYMNTAFKYIKDYQFSLDVLQDLEKYEFTKPVQDTIVKHLIENHLDEEVVWDALARREYRGHYYDISADIDEKVVKSTKFRIKRCAAQYKLGLEKISKAKANFLWVKYLDWLIELHEQKNNVFNESSLTSMLLEGLKNASQACPKLPEKYYVVWSKLMQNEPNALEIIEKGLTVIPDSLALWKLKMKHAVLKKDTNEFNAVFRKAITFIKEKSAPLWFMALRYHCLISSHKVIDSIYKQAITQPKEVSDIMKPEFIEWLALNKSINQARIEYNVLATVKPYCKQLHLKMAQIEQTEMDVQLDKIENIYKLLCEQFGAEDTDVWIKRVEFYLANHRQLKEMNDSFDINETLRRIYSEAESQIGSDNLLLSDFKEKYSKTGQEFLV